MKKLITKKTLIFIAMIALFIFGQILGTLVIKALFISYKIKELSPRLAFISGEIAKGDFSVSRKNDFILKAYDAYGAEMNILSDEASGELEISENDIDATIIPYIPKVIAGGDVAYLQKINRQKSESIVIGKSIIKDGEVIGIVFLLKPASDFAAVLNGFYLVFSVTLVIGTLFIGIFLYMYIKETKQLEQTRRDYIANISHELKSPIASIKALTETLADDIVKDDDTKSKYYGIIMRESNRLQKLISDMLDLSSLQSDKTAFQKELVNAKALMQQIYEKYFVIFDDMGIKFEVTEAAKNLPDIYTNRNRILQIFNILIDNAMKFVGEDGVITIDADINREYIKMKVSDNGMGIEKAALPYIFERFYKEDKSHHKGGSGLGLSIAKEITNVLGEHIAVNSERGKGTVFSFTIRRA